MRRIIEIEPNWEPVPGPEGWYEVVRHDQDGKVVGRELVVVRDFYGTANDILTMVYMPQRSRALGPVPYMPLEAATSQPVLWKGPLEEFSRVRQG